MEDKISVWAYTWRFAAWTVGMSIGLTVLTVILESWFNFSPNSGFYIGGLIATIFAVAYKFASEMGRRPTSSESWRISFGCICALLVVSVALIAISIYLDPILLTKLSDLGSNILIGIVLGVVAIQFLIIRFMFPSAVKTHLKGIKKIAEKNQKVLEAKFRD